MRIPSGIFKNISVINFFHLSLNQGVNVLIALIITPYLFQNLGEELYGLVSLALTLILLFGMLVNYGFNLNIPNKLALIKGDQKAKESLINEVLITRFILALIVSFVLLILISVLGLFAGYAVILAYSMVQLFNDALYPLFILQGFDRLSWIAKANAISKLAYLGLVLLLVQSPADALWVNFLLGSSGFIIHAVLIYFIYRKESIKFKWVSYSRIRFWLVSNFQFFSSTVASYVLINGGFILLKSFVSDAELGFYALAQRVAIILRMVPVFITQSILQNASRLYKDDQVEFERYLKRSGKNGVLVTFILGVLVLVTSKWVIRILAGKYIDLSANLLAILGFLPFIGMINVPNMIRILVTDQKYVLSNAIWITTLLMLAMSLIGCYYYGSYGLAIALILAELINYFVHSLLLKRAINRKKE